MRSSNPNAKATPWRSHTVRVQHVVQETPGVATYALVFTRPELVNAYRFLPGQFNMLYIPGVGESAISISSDPKSPHIMRHTIRSVGGVTQAIAEAGIGTTLGLRGPFGSSWPIEFCFQETYHKKDVIIVAGGIGLAPLRSAIYTLCQHRSQLGRITVLVGARSPENIWLSLERNMNCAVGMCGHCQLGPEFLCKDGPVLPYSRISDWLKVRAF